VSKEPPSPGPAGSRVDLHTHSDFSDGEHSPEEIALLARKAGVRAAALTDHDCLDGLPAFLRAASGFEPVPGVEISARKNGADVHILGFFVSPHDERLRSRLDDLARARERRARAMVARIRDLGLDLTVGRVSEIAGRGTVGRPHIATALVRRGAASSIDDAFRRYLRPGTPGYVPKPGPSPETAITWIHEAGGVAVLAHPGLLRRSSWIGEMARSGLDGLEVWHPRHTASHRHALLELARDLDLVPSGGSDYHGAGVGDARVGQEPVPEDVVERLRKRRPRP
jgi:predicted metal-dependent phosphoesterase TrpH